MEEELFLIYINELGVDWKGDNIYEFIFSDTLKDVDGEDWDVYPASGQPTPPKKEVVKRVGKLETELKFELVQESDKHSVWDAIDGIIALAYEDISDYYEYPKNRSIFHFGEKIKDVEDKLYTKDLILDYKKTKKNA